jgi:hypothetical protein
MIRTDLDPIGHVSPRPRVDLNHRRPADPQVGPIEVMSIHEKQRIWQLVVQVAESSNIGTKEI